MKYLLLLLLCTINIVALGKPIKVNDKITIEGEIIASSTSCIIIESKNEQGNILFWVVSEITNAFLPEIANYVCLKIVGEDNEELCETIATGVDFITSVINAGKSMRKILKNGIEHTAERGTIKSSLNFTTESIQVAYNIKSILEAYKKLQIINWDDISGNYHDYSQNDYIGEVLVENVTNVVFTALVSKDGNNWYSKTILPGKYAKLSFWKGYEKQKYGFLKGKKICNYQIFTDKTYKIRYSKVEKQFYLETL